MYLIIGRAYQPADNIRVATKSVNDDLYIKVFGEALKEPDIGRTGGEIKGRFSFSEGMSELIFQS